MDRTPQEELASIHASLSCAIEGSGMRGPRLSTLGRVNTLLQRFGDLGRENATLRAENVTLRAENVKLRAEVEGG